MDRHFLALSKGALVVYLVSHILGKPKTERIAPSDLNDGAQYEGRYVLSLICPAQHSKTEKRKKKGEEEEELKHASISIEAQVIINQTQYLSHSSLFDKRQDIVCLYISPRPVARHHREPPLLSHLCQAGFC